MGEDLSEMYLTLDCDHSMGMTVVGTSIDMWEFNYITSSSISLIEGAVMNASTNGTFSSISNSTSLKLFLENGSFIEENGNEFIVTELETGILRDINTATNLCGIGEDIAFERWYLGLDGYFKPPIFDLSQLFNDLVNGVEHLNRDKLAKIGDAAAWGIGTVFIVVGTGASNIAFPPDSLADGVAFGASVYTSFRAGQSLGEAWNEPWFN